MWLDGKVMKFVPHVPLALLCPGVAIMACVPLQRPLGCSNKGEETPGPSIAINCIACKPTVLVLSEWNEKE